MEISLASLGIHHLGLFVLAGWALNLTPGPDVFYMLSQALRGSALGGAWAGLRAGAVAMAGVCAGCLVHVTAATLGVSALVAASSTAFTVLKWVGAAYLVWVGLRMLLARPASGDGEMVATQGAVSLWSVFWRGFATNALNPKVALFILAFLPQFIAPGSTNPGLAFALLGLLFIVNSVPVNLAYVLLGAWAAQRVGVVRRRLAWVERAMGAVFVGFGLRLVWSDRP